MRTSDFDYDLPAELIAQQPAARRDESRLLVLNRATGHCAHRRFADLPAYLQPGDLLVVNDSKVLPARLRGARQGGGAVELLLLRELDAGDGGTINTEPQSHGAVARADALPQGQGGAGQTAAPADGTPPANARAPIPATAIWLCLARPAKRLRTGDRLEFGDRTLVGEVRAIREEGQRVIAFHSADRPFMEALARHGELPLPPYIREQPADPDRYQTVYAQVPGSVAAPTAGLHFTPELLAALRVRGVDVRAVTLHVGLGTFRPVQTERIEEHTMHAEYGVLPAETAQAIVETRAHGGRVIATGTTAMRVLESAARAGGVRAWSDWTDIFIYPGFQFRICDGLITNFHLPRSTLLMLVSAFAGKEHIERAYAEAIAARYRFFSFGDAMLIL